MDKECTRWVHATSTIDYPIISSGKNQTTIRLLQKIQFSDPHSDTEQQIPAQSANKWQRKIDLYRKWLRMRWIKSIFSFLYHRSVYQYFISKVPWSKSRFSRDLERLLSPTCTQTGVERIQGLKESRASTITIFRKITGLEAQESPCVSSPVETYPTKFRCYIFLYFHHFCSWIIVYD